MTSAKHFTLPAIVTILLLALCGACAADGGGGVASVRAATVSEGAVTRTVTYEDGRAPAEVSFRQIVLENEYLRVSILPELGGRVSEVLDKTTGESMFLKRPILWPTTKYTAYGSQLGGIEVNFPCFHHGNSFLDRWNWLARQEPDGTAVAFVGWTEADSRQRVVHRLSLRPGEAVMHSHYRFTNLNGRSWGFAPWTNTFFGYDEDLQYIIPTRWVVPHGFNDNNLTLLPWPWPEADDKSVCFWRNVTDQYNSVFAFALEEDFHGVYRHQADRGMVRLFDRRRMPGVKLYNIPPQKLKEAKQPGEVPYLEIWSSPALLHEDASWWEAWAAREYDEAYYPVHGIGGYRYANAHGAVNLVRGENDVEVAACVTRPLPGAVVTLAGMDGTWWRGVADLSPERPLRHRVNRAPGREPLTLRVLDRAGEELISYEQRPDPGPVAAVTFSGKALWQATPMNAARKAEQYHALWRGPTGGYGGFGEKGIAAYREILRGDPNNVEALLGLARSLMLDAQMRLPGRPGAGSPEQVQKLKEEHLAEAERTLARARELAPADVRAVVLAGLLALDRGDAAGAAAMFRQAPESPEAQAGMAIALASLGKAGEAAGPAEAAAAAFPDSSPVQQLAAGVALLGGRPLDALDRLTRLYDNDPLDAVTLRLEGLAFGALGRQDDALRADREIERLSAQAESPPDLAAELRRLGLAALVGWQPRESEHNP